MKLVIEQAGSLFTGWIASCLSCLRSEDNEQSLSRRQAMKSQGVEREMRVSHTQPHLITPMKLVVYDDLPSPGPPPRTSSLPSWIAEGRDIASRASNRASMSLKRQSTTPLRISAPTDFRRVDTSQSFASSPTEFQPLVLKIHTPGHRLSTLPTFDDFSPVGQQPLARPSRALFSPTDNPRLSRTRSHHPTSSVQLTRKPVGSGSRRSSLATLEQLLDKQSPSVASPLLPHFSTRSSTGTGINISVSVSDTFTPPQHKRHASIPSYSRPPPPPPVAEDERQQSVPKTPPKTPLQDRPLPSLPIPSSPSTDSSSSSSHQHSHSSPATTPETTPSRTGRVTQWLFQITPSSPPPKHPKRSDKTTFRTRTRARESSNTTRTSLSGSTAVSSPPTPFSFEKHPEHLPPSTARDAPSHPTIHENAPQFRFDELSYQHQHQHQHHRRSAIGVAF
ncbi:uncharacterized protein ACLA_074010 [Aspergillus clavatus NRRL 1]|uniref:Uncharacterized protein n=1 Tax=Aspergillus clavatus (strain ATCC 1007 / CBS 513.65 / DSM 816 / NCTC 3887 / NRRL 1 / QM 1276 / 107) TaxID=344612 RepID=A1C7J3_ASPCL|nr:uncharacterized protein ACLA_074010 [Aspergillus clavatus NRRL 1]EAW14364.1 hypothetical protein ACLA_074010 [Aspergillus clavatus NRRL 1]